MTIYCSLHTSHLLFTTYTTSALFRPITTTVCSYILREHYERLTLFFCNESIATSHVFRLPNNTAYAVRWIAGHRIGVGTERRGYHGTHRMRYLARLRRRCAGTPRRPSAERGESRGGGIPGGGFVLVRRRKRRVLKRRSRSLNRSLSRCLSLHRCLSMHRHMSLNRSRRRRGRPPRLKRRRRRLRGRLRGRRRVRRTRREIRQAAFGG